MGAMLVWLGAAQLDAALSHDASALGALTALVAIVPGLILVGLAVGVFQGLPDLVQSIEPPPVPVREAVVIEFRPRPRR